MKIELQGAGKRYNREWIFKDVHQLFEPGNCYALTGANGSGKSTLLQVIGGLLLPNSGKITYTFNNQPVATEKVFKHISFSAPYLELVEEMTLEEALNFHRNFKPFFAGLSNEAIAEAVGLERAMKKEIRNFSSGMKQRVRLAQAFFSATKVLLLDEPTANLDAAGLSIYHQLIAKYAKERLVIVASNTPEEYSFCDTIIQVQNLGR